MHDGLNIKADNNGYSSTLEASALLSSFDIWWRSINKQVSETASLAVTFPNKGHPPRTASRHPVPCSIAAPRISSLGGISLV